MARIVVGSYMVRYPLGGNLSWGLQWLDGFRRLGHDVYLAEKSGYPDSCFDPQKGVMSDDCTYGTAMVNDLLQPLGLKDHWCYVDAQGDYYGLSQTQIEAVFKSADLFLDMGTHGLGSQRNWLDEAAHTGLRVLIGTEPGETQMKMEMNLANGDTLPEYDVYFTTGMNIGTEKNTVPTAGRLWHPVFDPVVIDQFPFQPPPPAAPFTTVMNWQSHKDFEFKGVKYGQKDVEFEKFIQLPSRTSIPLEVAVAGRKVPLQRLARAGWRTRNAQDVTLSVDGYRNYIRASKGEFSVCKNMSVVTNTGWFSERSAAYLASGRPVVMQDTGFSQYLPCGRGLFAVRTIEEAAAALETIQHDYQKHAQWARELAMTYLDAAKILSQLMRQLGIS